MKPIIICMIAFGISLTCTANTSGEKIYKDSKFEIEWQGLGGQKYFWKEAQTACLKLGKDWRLPSKENFEKNARFFSIMIAIWPL